MNNLTSLGKSTTTTYKEYTLLQRGNEVQVIDTNCNPIRCETIQPTIEKAKEYVDWVIGIFFPHCIEKEVVHYKNATIQFRESNRTALYYARVYIGNELITYGIVKNPEKCFETLINAYNEAVFNGMDKGSIQKLMAGFTEVLIQ